MIEQWHWIRPEAFWLLLLLAPILWGLGRKGNLESDWSEIVDAHLLPKLLVGTEPRSRIGTLVWVSLFWLIMVMALAGPSWQKVPTPVFKKEQALVVVLDSSPLMLAEDIKPSRLTRAKYKLMDMLKARKEGQTALVVFSDEPYVVAPLTQDKKTLINLLPAISPEIMPAPGQRVDLALSEAAKLIRQSKTQRGEILLITGGFSEKEALEAPLSKLKAEGIKTSIYGVGTASGSPISLPNGGFLKDKQGKMLMARLDTARLKQLAEAGGGVFAKITMNNEDIARLHSVLDPKQPWQTNAQSSETELSLWRDEGHWLVLLLLPFLIFGVFRRGQRSGSIL